MTPLHLAVTGPSSRAMRWMLEQRIGLLHVEDNLGRTALYCCASEANLELLLAQGSAVMHTDNYGMNTLHRACFRGELELVRCLLKPKQPLDLRKNKYGTPQHRRTQNLAERPKNGLSRLSVLGVRGIARLPISSSFHITPTEARLRLRTSPGRPTMSPTSRSLKAILQV